MFVLGPFWPLTKSVVAPYPPEYYSRSRFFPFGSGAVIFLCGLLLIFEQIFFPDLEESYSFVSGSDADQNDSFPSKAFLNKYCI